MMKKLLCIVLFSFLLGSSTTEAAVTVRLSVSDVDPLAGTDLSLGLGQTGSLYVWMSTEQNLAIRGVTLDILSSDSSVLEATGHIIFNGDNRWVPAAISPGILGDLVDEATAAGFTGLSTASEADFEFFSEVQFTATALGSTAIDFQLGNQGFSDGSNTIAPGSITFVGGTVTAVPEPGTFAALGLGGLLVGGYRRIRCRKCSEVVVA